MSSILLEIRNEIVVIYLNEPKSLNALSQRLKEELLKALDETEKMQEVKVILITAKGRSFCAGGDIKAMAAPYDPMEIKRNMDLSAKIVQKIREVPKIVICMLHGYVAGAGISLALAADLILAEEETKLVLSFKNVGLIPDLGLHFYLPSIVGEWKAKEWMWSGKTITVEEAAQFGMVNQKVPKGELIQEGFAVAEELAKGPIDSFITSKEIMNSNSIDNLKKTMARENAMQAIMRGTVQHTQALEAFVSK
ncbi:enoyl-CoA hydratase-related protein [Sporosarcina sp. FSL W7-1349]|uniref:enoyl-CoA hydratase/isomerase family protein n=1 Tax=Sporosarcina sp. FSL W7-1349 TaxID=2921561 RepID=UPI0030F729C4